MGCLSATFAGILLLPRRDLQWKNGALALYSSRDAPTDVAPAIAAMHVAGWQHAAFQIAELIEHEQRMITGVGEVPIVRAAFLRAMGLADAAILG
jgi:hypothetical protein